MSRTNGNFHDDGTPIFTGGPLDPSSGGGPVGSTDAPAGTATGEGVAVAHPSGEPPAPAVQVQPSPVVIGDRVFQTQAEAIAYANGLERISRGVTPAQEPIAPANPNPAEILFEDPNAALAMVEDRIVNRINTVNQAQEYERNFWSGFYAKHPDLADSKDVVAMMQHQLPQSVKDMPAEQAAPILARNARERIARIRGGAADHRQVLPSGPAQAAGSSGASPPVTPAQPQKLTSFADEVAALRKRQ